MRRPDTGATTVLGLIGAATALGMVLSARGSKEGVAEQEPTGLDASSSFQPKVPLTAAPTVNRQTAVLAARRLNRAAATLAGSVLFDSAIEHYRGSFAKKAMYTPLVTASLSLLASGHGTCDDSPNAHALRDAVYASTALVGVIGTGFHAFNILKRPGGLRWESLFYSAPIGAPAALVLSGLLGFLSERLRDNEPGTVPMILGLPAGRAIGAVTGVGILGTVSEAALLHFRGAFQDPFMYLPVTVPPVAASLIGLAAFGDAREARPATRWWLRATAIIGVAGSAFHVAGVGRAMGGWRNWKQNVLDGPPIPAPPAFTGLALAGLAALGLLEDHPHD